jgi:hypothetical protein
MEQSDEHSDPLRRNRNSLDRQQTGQHRLGPVPLTDGRYFLSADVLIENALFADRMAGVDYEEATLEDVQHLLPVPEGL